MSTATKSPEIPFEQKLQNLISKGKLKNKFLNSHLIVFDIENNDRRRIFHSFLDKAQWRKFDKKIHEAGSEEYDYFLFSDKAYTRTDIYDILKTHNSKILIFDDAGILHKAGVIDLIEGGVCSSPDSGDKWPVRISQKKEFIFKGNIIILTDYSKEDFEKKTRFKYLVRDCVKA